VGWSFWLPILVLCSSLVTGLLIFPLRENRRALRTTLNLFGATAKLVGVSVMMWGVINDRTFDTRVEVIPGIDFVLQVDGLSLLFVSLSAVLWLVTTIYAIGYLEGSPNRSRFFGFFSICVTATMGIAMAGNLFTFFIFYELLTMATYPLVVHRGTARSLAAGRTYLLYTLFGGVAFLLGIVWLHVLVGPTEFVSGGVIAEFGDGNRTALIVIFGLLIAGLGVKAAIVPLHGWLPEAMVAPAPVSSLLHAVAVVKAGVFGIARVVYDVYGIGFALDLGVLTPLAVLASFTILYGSVRALTQTEVKRRLAYSTVSQLSYIVLGTATIGPIATTGALVHLMHQGFMKVTLFYCAGNLSETLGIHDVKQMDGAGRRMPITMTAFTLGAFGMIGIPPMAGFISKWHLGLGGLEAGHWWVVVVLVGSSVLNALYFLPLLYSAWFKPMHQDWEAVPRQGRLETGWMLLVPAVVTAGISLAAGLFAGSPISPLELTRFVITEELYGQ
jgi:multicomponent Na+:H+ antiporter subunit D